MIAEVVVDVPTNQTDRTFDYEIPKNYADIIIPGIRVIVPFGPRKIQGFVISVKENSTLNKLKPIEDALDLSPVLTEELLKLGHWLTGKTLCFSVSAYQSMLPAALKASYVKELRLTDDFDINELPKDAAEWFSGKQTVLWDDLTKNIPDALRYIQKQIREKRVEVVNHVKYKTAKKKIKVIKPALSSTEIEQHISTLNAQATKQKELLLFFIKHPSPLSNKELTEQTGASRTTTKALLDKKILQEEEVEVYRNPYENRQFRKKAPLPLTKQQTEVITPILACIENQHHKTFLIRGVTGSGKTEIYLQAIDTVLQQGKEAIMLVPEISLTPQMVTRFKERFGSNVAVLHSGLSQGEKYDEWRKIHRGEASVVVGARSAIFAPFQNIGIIIIDEEHESSYKQEENPRYHARDVAIYRGSYHECPVVLGSATPSLETYARAQKGVYQLCTLSQRVNERKMPGVSIVDMREELRAGNRSLFSKELHEKLTERLEKGEQSVLFLNRRGFSTFIICRDCGYVAQCPHCDISLTYHKRNQQLKCHYCGHEERLPNQCPECTSDHIRFFGTGTQKVEEELAKAFPDARVIRMDVDTTSRKGMHEKLLTAFGEQKADILLGTQMIAKGLDFPNVTLVGVLAADSMLHLPDFRSAEKTFQLLTQVSGRAGRHELEGEVVVQTYSPDHYSITLAGEHDYLSFYNTEMKLRKRYDYPPFYYLTLITVSHPDLMKVVGVSETIAQHLKPKLSAKSLILGPVASPIPRVKDRYRYHCMIKYKNEPKLNQFLQEIIAHYHREITKEGLQISIDPNAQMLM
jgi:primosomal protein N' (replication factor Y)